MGKQGSCVSWLPADVNPNGLWGITAPVPGRDFTQLSRCPQMESLKLRKVNTRTLERFYSKDQAKGTGTVEFGRAPGARGREGGKEGNEWPTGRPGQVQVEKRAPEQEARRVLAPGCGTTQAAGEFWSHKWG